MHVKNISNTIFDKYMYRFFVNADGHLKILLNLSNGSSHLKNVAKAW